MRKLSLIVLFITLLIPVKLAAQNKAPNWINMKNAWKEIKANQIFIYSVGQAIYQADADDKIFKASFNQAVLDSIEKIKRNFDTATLTSYQVISTYYASGNIYILIGAMEKLPVTKLRPQPNHEEKPKPTDIPTRIPRHEEIFELTLTSGIPNYRSIPENWWLKYPKIKVFKVGSDLYAIGKGLPDPNIKSLDICWQKAEAEAKNDAQNNLASFIGYLINEHQKEGSFCQELGELTIPSSNRTFNSYQKSNPPSTYVLVRMPLSNVSQAISETQTTTLTYGLASF